MHERIAVVAQDFGKGFELSGNSVCSRDKRRLLESALMQVAHCGKQASHETKVL